MFNISLKIYIKIDALYAMLRREVRTKAPTSLTIRWKHILYIIKNKNSKKVSTKTSLELHRHCNFFIKVQSFQHKQSRKKWIILTVVCLNILFCRNSILLLNETYKGRPGQKNQVAKRVRSLQ